MNPTETRKRLHDRLAELVKRDAALQKHLTGQDGRNEADFSDRVAFTEMDEVLEQLDESARTEIRSIQGALQRLEGGSYGTCAQCGTAIAPGRLEALPAAATCAACAS